MSTNADRLAVAVRNRRAELDVTQIEVWQAGGPSNTTLTRIENGLMTSLERSTAKRLDRGLRWQEGSARSVWNGGVPVPLPGGMTLSDEVRRSNLSDESKDYILRRLAEMEGPPPPEQRRDATGA